MIVQLILHEPFELSLMHCELGSSKNQITFDSIRPFVGSVKTCELSLQRKYYPLFWSLWC